MLELPVTGKEASVRVVSKSIGSRPATLSALCVSLAALAACGAPPKTHFQKTVELLKNHPDRFTVTRTRTRDALILQASDEGAVRVVYATFGVMLPPVPLQLPGTLSADTLLASEPVLVGDQPVIYRLRYSAQRPRYIVLDATLHGDPGSAAVRGDTSAFAREVWIPMEAVSRRLIASGQWTGDRSSPWLPKGCPRSISNIPYCS